MSALWQRIRQSFQQTIGQALGRLTERQQLMALGGISAGGLLFLLLIGLWIGSAIRGAEHRVEVKTKQLTELLELQGQYKLRQRQREEQLRQLGRSQVRLVSLVEQAAKDAGVKIGQLRPEDKEPSSDGVIESRVDLRASELSIDRVQKFLSLLEDAEGIVVVRRLKLDRPYRKETLEMELTVTTYKLKG